ncbi:MAG TPA: XdhC/CoxI family protein [Candidatus Limnocylindrales bacterium]|nr:XdhC/CoxI family protein [Candidatus Limnocylindrales bacterium]
MREVAAELNAWLASGDRVAIATVVGIRGSAPRPLGATLIVTEAGRIAGSVSNGCVEAAVYEEGAAALREGRARLVRYGISDELAFTVGLSCGGEIDVLVEPVGALHARALASVVVDRGVALARVTAPAERAGTVGLLDETGAREGFAGDFLPLAVEAWAALRAGLPRIADVRLGEAGGTVFFEVLPRSPSILLLGATHVAVALARLATDLGFRVTVADPRASLATPERFPSASIEHAWPDEAIAHARLGPESAVVLLSHDAKFDRPGLVAALRSDAPYVGAIGSHRTNEDRLAWLRAEGFSDDELGRLRAPIGLDIGARTAEETALAILAEIVASRRGRPGTSLSARHPAALVRA